METKVNQQFKILYAIAMILVVTGHCGGEQLSLFFDFFPNYVLLFVFCSGYFYKESNESAVGKYIWKKIKTLIIPLYVYNFIYMLIAQLLSLKGFQFSNEVNFHKLIVAPLTDGHQYIYNLSTWFIAPLFMTQVANILLRKFLSIIKNENSKEWIYAFISLLLGITGIFLAFTELNVHFWRTLDRLLFFMPFYAMGHLYKKKLEKRDHLNNTLYFLIIFSIALAIICINGGPSTHRLAWCIFPSFNLYPLLVDFLGIAFWLRVSKILTPVLSNSRCISLIANNTFSIMTNHLIGCLLVKSFFAIGYKYTTVLFRNFDWTAFYNNIWYYYLPKNLPHFLIVYIFFGIVTGICVQTIIDKVKQKIFDSLKNKKLYGYIMYSLCCIIMLFCLLIGYIINKQLII